MPTYDYKCTKCGTQVENFCKTLQPERSFDCTCGGKLELTMSKSVNIKQIRGGTGAGRSYNSNK